MSDELNHQDELAADHRAMDQLRDLHIRGFTTLVTFEQINEPPLLLPIFQPAFYFTREDVVHQLLRDRKDLVEALREHVRLTRNTYDTEQLLARFKDV